MKNVSFKNFYQLAKTLIIVALCLNCNTSAKNIQQRGQNITRIVSYVSYTRHDLHDKVAGLDLTKNTASLYQAVMLGNEILVKTFLGLGANSNVVVDERGSTLLHLVASQPNSEIVELLVKAGAKVDARDKDLNTPLHIAFSYDRLNIVRCFLEAGADPNIAFNQCYFPDRSLLHVAASHGNERMVNILLQFGADPNVRDADNNTPLHEAVKSNNICVIKSLLNQGANKHIKRKSDEKTPLDLTDNLHIHQLFADLESQYLEFALCNIM
ncbi:MAG: hypothetical protein BGO68_05300 [Candidatus Amoebophilus sp. 36-38]|nr:MAG: hypothetical protein BGO68_05300 [Candidatus Amoebophilus sp. 36-38]